MVLVPQSCGRVVVQNFFGGTIVPWETSTPYLVGNFVLHDNTIYFCLIDHTSTADFYADRDGGNWRSISSTYTHSQSSPSNTWTVDHNLGRYPNVAIRLTTTGYEGYRVEPTIFYTDENQMILTFSQMYTGSAHLI